MSVPRPTSGPELLEQFQLDLESDINEFTKENIDAILDELESDPELRDKIVGDTDLKAFSDEVQQAVNGAERTALHGLVAETERVVALGQDVRACDRILGRMADYLHSFQLDLGEISAEIHQLQQESSAMQTALTNRQLVEEKVRTFVQDVVVPPEAVRRVCEAEVNEAYLDCLLAINRAASLLPGLKAPDPLLPSTPSSPPPKAYNDLQPAVELLIWKAVAKVREFLIYRVHALRKPHSNIQILQQSFLVKYTGFYQFLRQWAPKVAAEVQGIYIETVSNLFVQYYKAYLASLAKLECDVAVKTDLLGAPEPFAKSFTKKRTSPFSLGVIGSTQTRNALLDTPNAPAIVPHLAASNSEQFPYEVLFRSALRLLVDTACSEARFCSQFFDEQEVVSTVIAKILAAHLEALELRLSTYFDFIGILLMLIINQQNVAIMTQRGFSFLGDHFGRVSRVLLARLSVVFELHMDSVRAALTTSYVAITDQRPHYVVRRYAELMASVLSLHVVQLRSDEAFEDSFVNGAGSVRPSQANPWGDILGAEWSGKLLVLRSHIEQLLAKLAAPLAAPSAGPEGVKRRSVFLINNYDLVLSVLEERGVISEEMMVFRQLHAAEVRVFVEEELTGVMGGIVSLLQRSPIDGSEIRADVVEVERLAVHFTAEWKVIINKINTDVMNMFPNFRNGLEVSKQVLTQLALYYARFEDLVKRHFGNSYFRKDMVPVSTIRYELQKYLSRKF
eukprot:TRINITY_DN22544_c0_g1_i1.p1 TRINITY_DN22544_c0_g1~~TRINITY_DN22544_c0_g1_i1.p1  ORF type:complete len:734 (-),score=256.38 TRINITY_DN22544_c0_g1_i1:92-2293(-)